MGKFFNEIGENHKEFIEKQHIFFVATAPLSGDGHVNLSPKGFDAFRVLSPTKVAYMDVVSSGNETSAHTLENGRITFMFCSFEGSPLILRLYGKGRAILPNNKEWEELSKHFVIFPSTRQIIVADIYKVQTSCGFGIPTFDYKAERDIHQKWAEQKGIEGVNEYKFANNMISLDGLPTDLSKNL
jgi:Pyridoxamine 5'-phosphate oxidase